MKSRFCELLRHDEVLRSWKNNTTAFLEKGEPFRERSPQHSVSTTGLAPFASQPMGPSSLKTALEAGRGRRRLRPYILHAKDFRGVTEPALRMTSPTPPSLWARSRPLRASNQGHSLALNCSPLGAPVRKFNSRDP